MSWQAGGSPMSEDRSLAEAIAPEILTPVQWYAGVHGDEPRFHSTKQLMLAVLMDALQCLQERRRVAEAEAWIADRGGQGPFAFETICDALGIDADYLSNGLREWQRQQLSRTDPQRQVRHPSIRRSGAIRSPTGRRRRRATEAALAGDGAVTHELERKVCGDGEHSAVNHGAIGPQLEALLLASIQTGRYAG